jgi:hypothetical protein
LFGVSVNNFCAFSSRKIRLPASSGLPRKMPSIQADRRNEFDVNRKDFSNDSAKQSRFRFEK